MSEGTPTQFVEAPETTTEHEFLGRLGIVGIAERTMIDHDGNEMTLVEALRICGDPLKASIEAQVAVFDELGVDPEIGMNSYMNKMSQAPKTNSDEYRDAKKK